VWQGSRPYENSSVLYGAGTGATMCNRFSAAPTTFLQGVGLKQTDRCVRLVEVSNKWFGS